MPHLQRIFICLTAQLLLLTIARSVDAEVVRYHDENGSLRYVEGVDRVPERYRSSIIQEALPKVNRVPTQSYAPAPGKSSRTSRKKVEIFVTSWCPYCKKLESYLKSEGVVYTRYDIEHDSVGKGLYSQLGGGGIPVIKIGSQVIRGFDISQIGQALK